MSKKNNRGTRAREHAFVLRKEKEAEAKKQTKQQKKERKEEQANKQQQQQQQQQAGGSSTRLGVKAKKGIKVKAKPIKLRKNKVVRGIKIVDAETRRRAKELLAAEEAMLAMEMDSVEKGKKKKPVNFATGEGMDMD